MELTIKKNSLFVRIFMWGWNVEPDNLNICKLFWGTLFFPITLMHPGKKTYRYVSRLTTFYFAGGVIFTVLMAMNICHVLLAIEYYLFAALFLVINYKEDNKKPKEELNEKLSRLTERGSGVVERIFDNSVVEWILNHTLYALFDFIDNVRSSGANRQIKGLFSMVAMYLRALKQKTCVNVKVV